MGEIKARSILASALPELFAFAIGLGLTWALQWKTTDLIWSLWLSSLVLGYLTILSTIAGGVYFGIRVIFHPGFPRDKRLSLAFFGSALALFFFGFFSLHFCAFHAIHAGFLSGFFPLEGVPEKRFFAGFMQPWLLWTAVFQHLLPVYGLFLIPVVVAERKHVFAGFVSALRKIPEGENPDWMRELVGSVKGKGKGKASSDSFSRPYVNIMRMHLLIFFFAFCHMLKVESIFVFVVVYFVYFFPWNIFRRCKPAERSAVQ